MLGRLRALRVPRLPPAAWAAALGVALVAANACYQLARKPTELLTLVAPGARKAPAETWRAYGDLFRAHATDAVRPELLAALAQAESAGDPLASPPWRLRWTTDPLSVYAPASSAVGLLQMTEGNYARARELCIRGGAPARDGPWYDPRTCFLNALYMRTVPGHAIEMTSAYLHLACEEILLRPGVRRPGPQERDGLVAVVHLCGPERGAAYARRGYRALPGERCGDQDLAAYVARVRLLAELFAARARDP